MAVCRHLVAKWSKRNQIKRWTWHRHILSSGGLCISHLGLHQCSVWIDPHLKNYFMAIKCLYWTGVHKSPSTAAAQIKNDNLVKMQLYRLMLKGPHCRIYGRRFKWSSDHRDDRRHMTTGLHASELPDLSSRCAACLEKPILKTALTKICNQIRFFASFSHCRPL